MMIDLDKMISLISPSLLIIDPVSAFLPDHSDHSRMMGPWPRNVWAQFNTHKQSTGISTWSAYVTSMSNCNSWAAVIAG